MQYVLAALILHETGAEINERNLTAVLEAADGTVEESRTKALVAALEGVDLDAIADGGLALPVDADGGSDAPPVTDADTGDGTDAVEDEEGSEDELVETPAAGDASGDEASHEAPHAGADAAEPEEPGTDRPA